MFKLVGIQGELFAIQDTDDNAIDILPKSKVCRCLNLGLQVGGISRVSEDSFDYTEEFFFSSGFDTDDDYDSDDDYYSEEDYDTEEDYYSDSEEDYDSDDDYYSDSEEDSEEDYDTEEDSEEDYNTEEDSEEDYNTEEDYDAYDDGYNDDDFGEEEVSTVNKLYSYLNEEQIKLLKRYYLWFSQRIFDEGRQQRTLRVTNNPRKLQKQQELNAMRNQGGMWAYAGFVDMGYRGADYCTLGHPLRYVHLAWDVSVSDIETSFFGEEYNTDIEDVINSNNCIKFGIDCISDFFEIDKEYTDMLRRSQREAIKDMDFMCQYYELGVSDKVISSFTIADEVVNTIAKIDAKGLMSKGSDYKCLINKGLTSFYKQFRQLNMIVPKSLIQEIRDNLVGWEHHKFVGWQEPNWGTLRNVLVSILGKQSENFVSTLDKYSLGYEEVLRYYVIDFFQLKVCGYYEYNADTFKDEGGASKQVKAKLYNVLSSVKNKFWSDVTYSIDYIKKLNELYNILSKIDEVIDSVRTPAECYSYSDCVWFLDEKILELNFLLIKRYSEEVCDSFYDSLESLRNLGRNTTRICKSSYGVQRSLVEFLDELKSTISKMSFEAERYKEFALNDMKSRIDANNKKLEEERLEAEERRLAEEKARQEEKAKKESVKDLKSDDDIIKYCVDNVNKVKNNPKLKFAITVLDTVNSRGSCSPKQMYYINQIYSELTGVQREDSKPSKTNLDDRKDLENAIDKVISDPTLLEGEENKEKVYAILTSIKKYRTISERQMKYAEIALRVSK